MRPPTASARPAPCARGSGSRRRRRRAEEVADAQRVGGRAHDGRLRHAALAQERQRPRGVLRRRRGGRLDQELDVRPPAPRGAHLLALAAAAAREHDHVGRALLGEDRGSLDEPAAAPAHPPAAAVARNDDRLHAPPVCPCQRAYVARRPARAHRRCRPRRRSRPGTRRAARPRRRAPRPRAARKPPTRSGMPIVAMPEDPPEDEHGPGDGREHHPQSGSARERGAGRARPRRRERDARRGPCAAPGSASSSRATATR